MATAIRLTTMPGKIRKGRLGNALVLDLFGGSLGQEDITIRKPGEVAPAVHAFGERIWAEHPGGIIQDPRLGAQRSAQTAGYDAAENAGEFKDRVFMHMETEDGQPVSIPALTAAAS